MPFMPFQILGIWFRGLLAVAILAGGIYGIWSWYDRSRVFEADPIPAKAGERADPSTDGQPRFEFVRVEKPRRVFHFRPDWDRTTALLAIGSSLLAIGLAGRWIGGGVARLASAAKSTSNPGPYGDPREERTGESHRIRRPDGSELHVECYGPPDAPPIVFSHGWGSNSTEWYYQKKALSDRYRLIVWDEAGLGLSTQPANRDYRLEKFAADLEAVLTFAGDRPAVLVGHSIGGMTVLTFCRLFPEALGRKVAGLVLVHTTYTNPVRTTSMATLYTALEKPVLIPLMHLTILTWPIVWALNWLSYLNGSVNRSTRKSSFAGTQTEGQVDFVARGLPKHRPDVLARGMLGMIAYDATAVLPMIRVPTLVVIGDKDTTTLPEAGERIARTAPAGKLATLAPARHMGLLEHHERFNELLSGFVDSCRSAGRPG
ncbi:alpha/beta fold hydrolase [Tundrisphaera sp. TA3]|uniref:alpha/beta fold hydrolase n=1 Tax=Tundrisphaera sp. TA3 TaxID=3435775 RepID=UPI003EBC0434